MKLRSIELADFGAIGSLLMRAFLPREPQFSLPRREFLQGYAQQCPASSWVAEESGRPVGVVFGHMQGASGWIGPLAVSPDQQKKGVGRALCVACIRGLQQCGCTSIGLDSDCSASLYSFYTSLGFKPGTGTVDGIKTIAVQKAPVDRVFLYSVSEGVWFLEQWQRLQQAVAPEYDYRPELEKLRQNDCGDGLLLMLQEQPMAIAVLQTLQRAVHDNPCVVRVSALVSHTRMHWLELASTVEYVIRQRYPLHTHLLWRVSTAEKQLLQQAGYRILQSGRRWFLQQEPQTNGTHQMIWE